MSAELPPDVEYVRTTDLFDQARHPAGLRRAHRVASGVWARLVVHTGALMFVFEDAPPHPQRLSAGMSIVIPPLRPHHVELDEPVEFAIEFYRAPGQSRPEAGAESTGLGPG